MNLRRKIIHAFSLIEVVVALGLFSFCVVAVVGLLSVGLGSTRSVLNEAMAVSIAESIFGAWEVQVNGGEQLRLPGFREDGDQILVLPPLSSATSRDFFFNGEGRQVDDRTQASMEMEYATENLAGPGGLDARLDLVFTWPVDGAENTRQTRRFSRIFVR
jgi:uncharacterized protein (TIGR02598 family)